MGNRPSVHPPAGVGTQRPPSDSPPSGRSDQEFLFHLYRGSELLQENSVDEAKAELERALRLQPRDVEGQALLGVVYFRLGLYPRAIEIFEKICVSNPTEVAPQVNVALCYLKTGQADAARERLESVVRQAPDHHRGWGYLGLVHQRFGDFEKAQIAFERAGRPKLAERMEQLVKQASEEPPPDIPELRPDEGGSRPPPSIRPSFMPESLRPADAPAGLEPATQAVGAPAPQLALPRPAARIARESELVFPENPSFALHGEGFALVRVGPSLAVRPQWISAMAYDRVPFSTSPLKRRSAGKPLSEPLGGPVPIVSLIGSGRIVLSPRKDTLLFLLKVAGDEQLYLKESHLVCFEPEVQYETGRLDSQGVSSAQIVKLWGDGVVAAYSRAPLQSLAVSVERPVQVQAERVIGWLGRLLPRRIPPVEAPAGVSAMVGFSGQGSVFLDIR